MQLTATLSVEQLLLLIAGLLGLCVLASKFSSTLGVPALVLFLVVGMLAGAEGLGGIQFSDVRIAQATGVIALIFILFSGGLDTSWRAVRPVLKEGIALATVGVLITALCVGLFAGPSWGSPSWRGCCSVPSSPRRTPQRSLASCACAPAGCPLNWNR
jgi:NhaP-type Na+/H+ and K+/H+ antiporter